jgi:hypothetical protein
MQQPAYSRVGPNPDSDDESGPSLPLSVVGLSYQGSGRKRTATSSYSSHYKHSNC